MATRDASTVYVQIVIAFTLWGSGVTGDACPLDSVGENPCFDTLIPDKTEPTNIRYVSSGSCDFRRGMCSYTQACQQNDSNASEWRRNSSQNDWFVETEFSGGNGSDAKSMTLESPPLHIRVPSCLTFTASATKSSKLTVVLRDANRNRTLCTKEITYGNTEGTFHWNLPSSITQVTFQGIGRGIDGPYVVRLYSVAIEPGCCIYKDWLLPLQNSSLSPYCTWNAVNWTTSQTVGQAVVQHGDSENRLTSPVISGPPAYSDGRGSGGCLSFSFFLQVTKAVSLTVSIIPSSSAGAGQASVTPTWRMDSGSDMDGNRSDKPQDLEMFPGQMPVFLNGFLSRLFRVQFSVESNVTVVVIVRNVSYERDNTIPCPFIPPQARVPGFDADNTAAAAAAAAVVAAIAGGTCAAAVFVIVLSLCLCVRWRKRQRRENKSDKSSQAVTMRDIIQPEADRPDSFNAYTEISLRGSVIPITHDTGPVSAATAATSANDVTSQALNREQPETTDRSNPGTSNFASAGGASCSENGMLTKLDSAGETVRIIKRKHDDRDHTADAGASCPQKYVNDSANTHSEQKHGNCSQRSLARDRHSNDEFANAGTQATQMTDSETSEKQLENAPAAAHKPKLTEELYNRLGERPKTSSVLYDRVGKKNEQSLAACNRLAENAEAESTVYNRLGEVKGGSPTKAREKTARAYDHVGPLNETVYDVSQRDMQHRVIDGVYDHLSATFPHEST